MAPALARTIIEQSAAAAVRAPPAPAVQALETRLLVAAFPREVWASDLVEQPRG